MADSLGCKLCVGRSIRPACILIGPNKVLHSERPKYFNKSCIINWIYLRKKRRKRFLAWTKHYCIIIDDIHVRFDRDFIGSNAKISSGLYATRAPLHITLNVRIVERRPVIFQLIKWACSAITGVFFLLMLLFRIPFAILCVSLLCVVSVRRKSDHFLCFVWPVLSCSSL